MNSNILSNTKLNPIVTELFIRDRKVNIFVSLLHNLILLYQKILELTQHTKFQTKESFNKSHLIDPQILAMKIFTTNVLQNHILLLVSETSLASDNPSRFLRNLSKRMTRFDMKNCDMILTEKKQKY